MKCRHCDEDIYYSNYAERFIHTEDETSECGDEYAEPAEDVEAVVDLALTLLDLADDEDVDRARAVIAEFLNPTED